MSNRILVLLLFICVACGGSATLDPSGLSEDESVSSPIDIPLAKGIDESADPKIKPWSITSANNLRFDRAGELAPRTPHFQEYVPGTRVRRIIDLNGSVAAMVEASATSDADLLLARRNDTAGTWSVTNHATGSRGDVSTSDIDSQYVPLLSNVKRRTIWQKTGDVVGHHAVAVSGTYRMHAFDSASGVKLALYDGDRLVMESAWYANLQYPKVFYTSTGWRVFAVNTTTHYVVTFLITAPVPSSWPSASNLVATSATQHMFDVTWPASGNNFMTLVFTATNSLQWYAWAKSNLAAVANYEAEAAVITGLAVALSEDGMVAAWSSATTGSTRAAWMDPSLEGWLAAATTVVASIDATAVAVGGSWLTNKVLIYATSPTAADPTTHYVTFSTAAAVSTLQGVSQTWNWSIVGAPVAVAARDFFMGYVNHGTGMLRLVGFQVESNTALPFPVLAGDSFNGYSMASMLPRAIYADGTIYWPVLERNDDRTELHAVLYTAEINGIHVGHGANDGTLNTSNLAGGMPVVLNDYGSVEPVPLVYPVLTTGKAGGTGITGTVSYIGIYEVSDAHGRIGWSAPSPATTPIALVNENIDIEIPELHVTRMPYGRDPRYRVYRSLNSGPYYQAAAGTLTRTATGHIHVTDSDPDLSDQAMLYSDGEEGSEAERFLPPFSTVTAVHKSRAWSASGKRVYFSQLFDSEFMPQFTDVFYVEVPARVTGLASMGDFLWILTEDPDGLYYVTGDGPDSTGASGWYASPSPVAGAPGLPQELGGQNSVLVADGVLYWRSARGIEASSGGQVQLISEPIRETLASYPVVLGVSYWPERGESHWLVTSSTDYTGTRRVLVYNHRVQAWTTHSLGGIVHADTLAYYSNRVFVAGHNGDVWSTDTTRTADETLAAAKTAITTTLTVEGHPFGLNGFGLVKEVAYLGTNGGRFSTALTVTTDGTVVENADAHTFEETDFAVGAYLSLPHQLWEPRCSEAVIKLESTGLTQSGAVRLPPTWHGLTVDAVRLPGARRPIAAEAF